MLALGVFELRPRGNMSALCEACRKNSRHTPRMPQPTPLTSPSTWAPTDPCTDCVTTLSVLVQGGYSPMDRYRTRLRRSTAVVFTAAFVMTVGSQGAAVALPEAPTPADRGFTSSFEAGEPAPDWISAVDSGRASGVDGGYRTGIPGNVTDHVTDVRASAENASGGEVKENLADSEPGTKWLAFASTGWAEFDLDTPVKAVTYALTSANDFAERDPRDWSLKGSTDGKDWKTLDTRADQTFGERFQTRSYDIPADAVAEYRHFRLEITRNNGASGILQLADLQLSTGGNEGPVPPDML